ncbi:NUDIX domain-containing protein [Levilactobacillus namurensis]|uniref:NUDIX domain-containing protein n=1 Tax=Levilactobacillus namurensis TaxID=380393 RepID=UPI0004639B18|nr:NUDIX domain-containing protein [Levilactobacillus namurensis]
MRSCARCFVHDCQTDTILLVERFKDRRHYWTVPGGGILAGETPAKTVQRELDEELLFQVQTDQLELLTRVVRLGQPETYFVADEQVTPELSVHSVELARSTATNRYQPQWVPRQDVPAKLPYLADVARLVVEREA